MPVDDVAARLAGEIHRIATHAHTEEDLRIGTEGVLQPALQAFGVEPAPRYESSYGSHGSVFKGRSDAVYGRVVIEYERPGTLRRRSGVRHAAAQLEAYLRAESGKDPDLKGLRRAIGVGFDGESIFFLRYSQSARATPSTPITSRQLQLPFADGDASIREEPTGGFQMVGPHPVNADTIQSFLLYLRALRRRPLTPDSLADEFGPKGQVAGRLVGLFYAAVNRADHPKVVTLFQEWDRLFGIVYGQDLAKAQQDGDRLAQVYGLPANAALKPLLFAVHTYFALLMKLLACEFISLQHGSFVASPTAQLAGRSADGIYDQLMDLEDGGPFARLGVRNFLEGDFFGWYLAIWDVELADQIRSLAHVLADFEPATGTLQPDATRDLLKKLYQYLVPPELRHDLGEYYTPDWLAEFVLDEAGYDGDPSKRLLDPTCGSGTFLILAIRRAREFAAERFVDDEELVGKILDNIVGFDLNPVAVIAARTNYLLALGNLIRHRSSVELPIYLCDSVLTPSSQTGEQGSLLNDYFIPSTVGPFYVPRNIVLQSVMPELLKVLEETVRLKYSSTEFLALVHRKFPQLSDIDDRSLQSLFLKVSDLEEQGRDGIWSRIIKNAFAPVFKGTFDYVVGNPPWVNWESLADDYRQGTVTLWRNYGLFTLRGQAARLGGGKKDLSMLVLYAAADNYLRESGRLGFVVTQTLFKTKGAADGFRRFRLGDRAWLRVLRTHDMSELQPFEGASNRSAVLVLQKGDATTYPVPYVVWRKRLPGRLASDASLPSVKERTTVTDLLAEPIDASSRTSPWVTAPGGTLRALRRAIGPSPYRAHAGACTWANGVFWIRVLETRRDGLLVVENLYDEGRLKLPLVREAIEPDLVYPLLRGRDVSRWNPDPSAHILVTQDPTTRTGYKEAWLKVNLPHTYAYLKRFEKVLRGRSGYIKYFNQNSDPFYSLYNVSSETFSLNKVVWREQASEFTVAAVVSAGQPIVPDHKLMLAACQTSQEADYLAAVLNSSVARLVVDSYALSTSTSTHVLEHVAVPKYDSNNSDHSVIGELGRKAHELASGDLDQATELAKVEAVINRRVAALWEVTTEELAEIDQTRRRGRDSAAAQPSRKPEQEHLLAPSPGNEERKVAAQGRNARRRSAG